MEKLTLVNGWRNQTDGLHWFVLRIVTLDNLSLCATAVLKNIIVFYFAALSVQFINGGKMSNYGCSVIISS